MSLSALRNLSQSDLLLASLPSLYYRLLKSDTNTRTLANPQLRTTDGIVAITPREDCYLSMIHTTEITLRIGNEFKIFTLKNAAASLRSGHLTVLAEEIHATETPVV